MTMDDNDNDVDIESEELVISRSLLVIGSCY